MSDVHEHLVDEHQARLKHIKEPLVTYDGTEWHRVDRSVRVVKIGYAPVLDHTEDGPYGQEYGGRIECPKDVFELGASDAVPPTPPVEYTGQQNKQSDDHHLNQERRFEEVSPNVLFPPRKGLVGA